MDKNEALRIIDTLSRYSEAAQDALECLQKYDYYDESSRWEETDQPTIMEIEHPTLRDLYRRLARFTTPILHRQDNLKREELLSEANIRAFANYLQVSGETLLAARMNRVPIEPMLEVADSFEQLGRLKEARLLNNIYEFAYGIRKWHQTSKRNPGTPIQITLELNYDDVSPEAQAADEGFRIFASLFNPSCNYTGKQKRNLYNRLKALYKEFDPKDADKTIMAAILILRKPKSRYGKVWNKESITTCKERAMASMGRDTQSIKSYSENSLTTQPKLALAHVKRAETIIAAALDSSL